MIQLTRLNNTELYVNDELVESVEKTPDTVLTFVSGRKLLVKEDIENIISRIKEFRHYIHGRN